MQWFIGLLGIETPPGTWLDAAELSFRGFMPWWLATLFMIAAATAIFYLYCLEKGAFGWPRRLFLTAVRTALLGLLLLLLFRPVLLADFQGERQRPIVLLIDNSQSLKLQDRRLLQSDRVRVAIAEGLVPPTAVVNEPNALSGLAEKPSTDPSRAEIVKAILRNPQLQLLAELEKRAPLRPLLFGYSVHGLTEESGTNKTSLAEQILKGFRSEEVTTRLADAVVEVLDRKDGDAPAAIVIITDGQDNASKWTLEEAARKCAAGRVPLHIYGVGTAEGGILALKEMGAPDTIFVKDLVTVPLRWRAQGFPGGKLELSLTLGGKQVAHREIDLQTGQDLRESLDFTVPDDVAQADKVDLVAQIGVKGNAKFQSRLERKVSLVDHKIKVLVIENYPRWEYKFLQPALGRDRRVEPYFLLLKADKEAAAGDPHFLSKFPETREKFFGAKYNVIVLGDVAAEDLGEEHLDWIREWVSQRGGLIAIAGRQNLPATYEAVGKFGKFAEVLPVEFEKQRFPLESEARTQEFLPALSEVGRRTEMLFLADTPDENWKAWSNLKKGFHWQYPVLKLRPGAVSLLENPRAKMGDQKMPVLASHYYGQGQVLFMATDETWRCRYDEEDKHFTRFWGQIVYQLGLPSLLAQNASRVQVALQKAEAILDTPSYIYVRLVDEQFRPRKEAQVDAELIYLDAKPRQEKLRKIKLLPVPGRDGEYRALLTHDQPGRWQLRIDNAASGADPKAVFDFRVEVPPHHELEESGLAERALRDFADQAGGRFYREEDLHRLPQEILPQTVRFQRRQEAVLWNPLALVMFVLLITVEWVVRKFSNLS